MYDLIARSYNKYFDGFSERDVVTKNGKVKTERVYTGDYYREKVDDDAWKKRRIAVGVLYCIALVIFLLCGIIDCSANSCWYVILFYGLTFVTAIFASMNVYTKVTADRDMIIRVFRSVSDQYRKRILFMAVCMLLTAVGVTINLLLNINNFDVLGLICLAGYVFSGSVLYQLYRLEDMNIYQKIENKTQLQDADEYVQIMY